MKLHHSLPQPVHDNLAKLEALGFKFIVRHHPTLAGKYNGTPYVGLTLVEAIHFPSHSYFTAESHCSVRDHFNRARGTHVAFNRVLQHIQRRVGRDQMKEWLS